MQALKDQDKAGPICIGDFVSLFVEELNGFMTADGFTDDGLYVQCLRKGELFPASFEASVFQLQPKQDHHAQLQLEKFLESCGVAYLEDLEDNLSDADMATYRKHRKMVVQEMERNKEDRVTNMGRELRFSMPFQLLHVKSQKFVRVCLEDTADAEGNHVPIVLTRKGKPSCFRFRSRHNLKLADDAVHNLEATFLVPENLFETHYLNCDVNMTKITMAAAPKLRHRVACVGTGSTCLVQRFSREHEDESAVGAIDDVQDRRAEVPIYCGQVVRLLHPDQDMFLETTPRVELFGPDNTDSIVVLEPAMGFGQPDNDMTHRRRPPSIHSMWLIEDADPSDGRKLDYDAPIRIRNVATGGYLVPHRTATVTAKQVASWTTTGRVVHDSIATLRRMADQSGQKATVNKRSVVWINFPNAANDFRWLHVREGGHGEETAALSLVRNQGATDGFVILPVHQSELTGPFRVVSVCNAIRAYIARVKTDKVFDSLATNHITEILLESCRMFRQLEEGEWVLDSSQNEEDATRKTAAKAEAFVKRQTMMRQLQLLDLLVHLTDVKEWMELLPKLTVRELRNSVDMMHVRGLYEVCFRLLALIVRKNPPNGMHFLQFVQSLLYHFSEEGSQPGEPAYLLSLQHCITDLFHDNYKVLAGLEETHVNYLVHLLRHQRQLTPTYVKFLSVLLTCEGQAVPGNQRTICDLLFKRNDNTCLPVSMLRDDRVLVSMPLVGGSESHRGLADPVDLEVVLSDPVASEYYNECVTLLSLLCLGRTKIVHDSSETLRAEGLLDLNLCLHMFLSETMPKRTKAGFTELLNNAFIDSAPQENMSEGHHLQVWSELYESVVPTNQPLTDSVEGPRTIAKIKAFALRYIETNVVQGYCTDDDRFTLAIVRLLENLVYFGFFNYSMDNILATHSMAAHPYYVERLEALHLFLDPLKLDATVVENILECQILVQPVVMMLDPATDGSKAKSSKTVIETKMRLCSMLELICSIRLRLRKRRMLQIYDSDLQKGLVVDGDDRYDDEANRMRDLTSAGRRADFEYVFDILEMENEELTRILGLLLQFQEATLDKRALKLIIRVYSQRNELLEALNKLELFVNQVVVHVYFKHKRIVEEISDLVSKLVLFQHEAARQRDEEIQKFRHEQHKYLMETEEVAQQMDSYRESRDASILTATPKAFLEKIGGLRNPFSFSKGLFGMVALTSSDGARDSNQSQDSARRAGPKNSPMASRPGHKRASLWAAMDTKHSKTSRRMSITQAAGALSKILQHERCSRDDLPGQTAEVAEKIHKLVAKIVEDISSNVSVINIPIIKIQKGLRGLGAHTYVLHILEALLQSNDAMESKPLFDLAKECFSMLTWFSLSNVRSGCLLHPHMDVFMEYLESEDGLRLGVDETITSIYFNNRILCTQSQDKLQRAMLSLICKNQRYPYLKILCTVMSTNGVPVKRNQTDILTLLDVQRDKTFSMFEGAEGLARLKNLMLSGEHLGTVQGQMLKSEDLIRGRSPREMPKLEEKKDESSMLNKQLQAARESVVNSYTNFDSRLLYYLHTIKLLYASTLGTNATTERIATRLLPMERCVELVTAVWCIPEVKIAVLNFILECYLIREEMGQAEAAQLLSQSSMWKFFDYFTTVLQHLIDPMSNETFCRPKEPEALTKKILQKCLPIVKQYFTTVKFGNMKREYLEKSNRMCDALVKFWAEGAKTVEEQKDVASVLHVFEQKNVTGSEGTRRMLRTLLQADTMNLLSLPNRNAGNEVEVFSRVATLYPSFLNTVKQRIDTESENADLIRVCREIPRVIRVITDQLSAVDVDRETKSKYLGVLQMLWETLTKELSVEESIDGIGLTSVLDAIMRLLSSGTNVRETLRFANSLLIEGGRLVQKRFFDALKQERAESFLRELLRRIEVAGDEVREMKTVVNQVILHARLDKSKAMTLKELVAKETSAESTEHGEDASHTDHSEIKDVLSFLKNLCEGHFLDMQNLLRRQPNSEHTVNLITAVATFVIDVEQCLSPLNIEIATDGFATITEFLQGPCRGNIYAIVHTPLLEAINSIVRGSHVKYDGVLYPREYHDQSRELKAEVVTTLIALMEGSSVEDTFVAQALIRSLDLNAMLEYAIAQYKDWQSLREEQRKAKLDLDDRKLESMNKSIINTGFKYYIMLRSLSDYESEPAPGSVFFKLEDRSIPAIKFYANGIGCLEILKEVRHRPPEILKVYFHVPRICSRITQKMKEEILWQVDRTNDVTRLRDFFVRVEDLYHDMKYQEWLSRRSSTVLIQAVGSRANNFYLGNVAIMNLLLLIFFQWREVLESDPDATWEEMQHVQLGGVEQVVLQDILPSFQLVLEGIMLLNYTITSVPEIVRKRFKEEFIENWRSSGMQGTAQFNFADQRWDAMFFVNCVRHALSDNNFTSGQCFVWRLFTFTLALTINILTDDRNQIPLLFYFILLWEVFPRSKQIGFVLRAVIQGGSQLVALAGMLVIFTYWFGLIGFLYFPDKFQFRKAEVVDGSTVQNSAETGWGNNRAVPLQFVWQGMLMVIDQGVRKDDVGEALDKFNWPVPCPNPTEFGCPPCDGPPTYECIKDLQCDNEEWQQKINEGYLALHDCANVFTEWPQSKIFIRMVYTFAFFIMVSAVALEIVFGVIVDSFKALREENEQKEKDITNKCFICGQSRNIFDSGPGGFQAHVKEEHNMWMYMYFLIHIREMEDKTELNGIESYVYGKSIKNDTSFFPVGRAIRLEQGGGLGIRTEARRRKEATAHLVGQQAQSLKALRSKTNHLLQAYGLVRGKGEPVSTHGEIIDEGAAMAPAAVREAGKRIVIRQMYHPLEALIVPAAEPETNATLMRESSGFLRNSSTSVERTATASRDPLAAGGSPDRRAL